MNSICRFLPSKTSTGKIKTVHFVYETDFASMVQPFIKPIYYVHLVTSGKATLKFAGAQTEISEGTLFFFFPGVPYEIEGDGEFRYMYVSFMGASAPELLEELGITLNNSVFYGFSHITEFWFSSILRINQINANILAESVLLYTLSFIPEQEMKNVPNKNSENLFSVLVDYTDTHFRESDLTLRRMADIFAYTEKYLSHYFKEKMNMGFNSYLTNLRLQYAHKLIEKGEKRISYIAAESGFADSLYFSKVFKKSVGVSPTEYIKNKFKTE